MTVPPFRYTGLNTATFGVPPFRYTGLNTATFGVPPFRWPNLTFRYPNLTFPGPPLWAAPIIGVLFNPSMTTAQEQKVLRGLQMALSGRR